MTGTLRQSSPGGAGPDPEQAMFRETMFPVYGVVSLGTQRVVLEILSYHWASAVLRCQTATELQSMLESRRRGWSIDLCIGGEVVQRGARGQMIWCDRESGLLGCRFEQPIVAAMERTRRAIARAEEEWQVELSDPVLPDRKVRGRVLDLSPSGMLLRIPGDVQHWSVGFDLSGTWSAHSLLHGQPIRLTVENQILVDEGRSAYLGVSVQGPTRQYLEAAQGTLWDRPARVQMDEGTRRRADRFLSEAYQTDQVAITEETWQGQTVFSGRIRGVEMAAVYGRVSPVDPKYPYLDDRGDPLKGQVAIYMTSVRAEPRAASPAFLVALLQRFQAWAHLQPGHILVVECPEVLVPVYRSVGFVVLQQIGRQQGGTIKMGCPSVAYPERYLNPLRLSYLAGAFMDQLLIAGVLPSDKGNVRLLGRGSAKKDRSEDLASTHAKGQDKKVNKGADAQEARRFVHPKWTAQHFLAIGIAPYFSECDARFGSDSTDEFLRRFNLDRVYFKQDGNWVSVAFMDELLKWFADQGGDPHDLSRRAAERFLTPSVMGIMYYVAKHFVSPYVAFQSFERVLPLFDKSKSFTLEDLDQTHAIVLLGYRSPELIPQGEGLCGYWEASFRGYLKLLTGREGEVRKTACVHRGDGACRYEIRWNRVAMRKRWLGRVIAGSAVGSVGAWAASMMGMSFVSSIIMGGLSASGFAAAARVVGAIREKNDLERRFDQYQDISHRRYQDLQATKVKLDHRYREAQLLDTTARAIQEQHAISAILRTSLGAVCEGFGFDRAFIALRDSSDTYLQIVSASGSMEHLEFVSRVRIPIHVQLGCTHVLVATHVSGESAVINNVERNQHQFRGEARFLVDSLGMRRCAVVSIRAQSRYGVLVADKSSAPAPIGKSDLVLLKRMAQHVALALDKQSKLDREHDLRQVFQKYVPAHVIEDAQTPDGVRLGGKIRTLACMFLDLRGFTRISEGLSPIVTLEILNRFYERVYAVVARSGGLIDKFLGDGALITWGALEKQDARVEPAIAAGIEILDELESLNLELKREGLPALECGMGVHLGPAIVGNVGARERMEFTCIGPTINLASRLEGLCRVLDAKVVILAEMLEGCEPGLRSQFEVRHGMSVKGIERPLTIAFLPRHRARVVAVA